MEEKKSRRSYQESAGLRAGRREEKRPGQQIPEQLLPPMGQEPRGQPPPPPMEGTTRGATADPNTGAAGRGPGCNMESPIRGAKEERAHTVGAGLPATGMPPAGEEAMPRSRGAPGRGGAEESYPGITTPRGTGGEAKGHLSPAAPPPAAGRETGGEGRGAKWSLGRKSIVRGPELWRLLKE